MNNKMVLNIMIVYFVILSIVLIFQLTRINNTVSAPSNSGAVLTEDRLNNAVVFYNDSPVLLSNKKQMLLDRTNPSYTPVVSDNKAYLPVSFFTSVYGANVSYNNSDTSATIRFENKALVINANEATVVDNSNEKELELTTKPIVANNVVCVPADVFAQAYNKEVYIYGSMGILSSSEFSQEDNSFLDGLVSQVNDLPYISNENNLKSVAGISGTDDIFANIESKTKEFAQKNTFASVRVLETEDNDNIAANDNYIYYGASGRVEVLSYSENGIQTVSAISLDESNKFNSEKLILNENRLIVIGGSSGGSSGIFIYDITNPSSVQKIREYTVSGFYKNAVLSGEYLYLLTQSSVYSLYKDGHFNEPEYKDSITGTMSISFENIQYFPEIGSDDFVVVSAINLKNDSAPQVKAFVGAGSNIYMSQSNLYISKERTTAFDDYENIENTHIYRYSLTKGSLIGSGKVGIKGHLINQAAISEDNGYCRVVTKFTDDENDKKVCNVYVLNNNLEICGQANKVANDDDISYAVFTDNEILLTPANTGGNIYGVNIENPTLPQGRGGLKLSEGNTLIYKYDENTVVAVDDGNGVLKIGLYDITDYTAPEKLFSQELGRSENITTQLFDNKGGFLFDKEKNIMVVPVKITNGNNIVFDGAYVYTVFRDEGINRIGTLMSNNGLNSSYKFKGKLFMFNNNGVSAADMKEVKILNNISFDEKPTQ